MKKTNKSESKHVDHDMFLNQDGMPNGGVDVEVSKPTETQDVKVQGQRKVLSEKQRTAKWY